MALGMTEYGKGFKVNLLSILGLLGGVVIKSKAYPFWGESAFHILAPFNKYHSTDVPCDI